MLDLQILAILLAPWALLLLATRSLLHVPAAQRHPRLVWWLWALPGMLYLGWVALLLHDTAKDPTSHNLWPLTMVMLLMGWGLWAGALRLGLWLAGALRRPS